MLKGKAAGRPLRVAISGALLALLLFVIDWEAAAGELKNVPLSLIVLAVTVFGIQFVISAWKWRASLLAHNVKVPFGFLLRTYCVGAFFGSFLPSNVGGDIYRSYNTSRFCSLSMATLAVFLERVIGLLALLLVGAAGGLWLLMQSGILSVGQFAIALALLISAYLLIPVFAVDILHGSSGWKKRIPTRLRSAVRAVDALVSNEFRFLELLGASLVFQIIATLAVALLFVAVGGSWFFAESAIANAAGSIVAVVPVSINGIGVTEASFAGVAAQLGVNFTTAVVVSFLVRILVLPLVLAFGVMYMLDEKESPLDAAHRLEAETI